MSYCTWDCIDHGNRGGEHRYASCWYKGKYIDKHVRALIEATGEQPEGRRALHSCDNKRCINPLHLRWGSQADNVRDRGLPVLTDAQVAEVRSIDGLTQREIARRFGVSRMAIQQIRAGSRR